jgi:uncharacterized protein (DUF1499 family)
MHFTAPSAPSLPSLWTSRLSLFCVGLVLVALPLHQLLLLQTPTLLTILKGAFAGAAVAIGLGLLATVGIWRTGEPGTARVVFGIAVSLALLAWPAFTALTAMDLPEITDVTTDTQAPPPFTNLGKQRVDGANPAAYNAARFASVQAATYPDLKPLAIGRSTEEAFEVVVEALKKLKIKIEHEQLPNARTGQPGFIEAIDRTTIIGFRDDVAIRVSGDARQARIDLRSASRYGGHDLGRNAKRLRDMMREIQIRLDQSLPQAGGLRALRNPRTLQAVPKRQKDAGQTRAGAQKGQAGAQSGAQRGPGQKGRPPSQDERQSRDKRPRQSFE